VRYYQKEKGFLKLIMFSKGYERNATTGWDETYFRMYDPAIGRFHGMDPLAVKYAGMTPYNYVGGNPIMYNDPLGDDMMPAWSEGLEAFWQGSFGGSSNSRLGTSANAAAGYGGGGGINSFNKRRIKHGYGRYDMTISRGTSGSSAYSARMLAQITNALWNSKHGGFIDNVNGRVVKYDEATAYFMGELYMDLHDAWGKKLSDGTSFARNRKRALSSFNKLKL
jgi:RHS repeat-associated protein